MYSEENYYDDLYNADDEDYFDDINTEVDSYPYPPYPPFNEYFDDFEDFEDNGTDLGYFASELD